MNMFRHLFKRSSLPLGQRGEAVAAKWLRKRGYRILQRNLPVADDEADLVAVDPDGRTIVIVEVKTRADSVTAPEASITPTKQFRLARLASRLAQSKEYADKPFRFDAVAVIWPEGGEPQVRHVAGAFEALW
jgi:putative endonuclease